MRVVLLTLAAEYALGAMAMLVRICVSRPWRVGGWSRRRRLWAGIWETAVNMILWPIPCAQVLWKELA